MKAIVLSFQGTKDEAEALVDLDFTQIQYPFGPVGARVHQGFFREWNSYGAAIMSDLLTLLQKHPDAKFILPTGHSLGAAVALLGGLDAIRMLRMNASRPQIPGLIYTFGQSEQPKTREFYFYADFIFRQRPSRAVSCNSRTRLCSASAAPPHANRQLVVAPPADRNLVQQFGQHDVSNLRGLWHR